MAKEEAESMYNMEDYRTALSERDSYDIGSAAWNLAQQKVQSIVAVMVASGNRMIVKEIVDEVYSLNDCGMEFENWAIQHDIWLLESNGHTEEAEEIRQIG